ncbi:PhnB protein [Tangfeifania diversioriginum]|uniref:PhnB protein n=1 Tax=Tangfeifania diversioriginum TaxID=1168035 RepID=A0A1M6GAT0_9BACT|nr:VOC family protein [Tangfeifania diversioriginum]SHJ07022.1 PhnB protein [Tangfeifania diversioriginum]
MKQAAQPYFHFDGNCREAMEFYGQLFGGKLEIMTIGESSAKEQFSKDLYDQVLHSHLQNGDFFIMASDMCGMGELTPGNSVDINLNCTSEEEINHLYKQLAEGGKILDELKEQFWGALFAMVTDRFGVRWMLSFDKK